MSLKNLIGLVESHSTVFSFPLDFKKKNPLIIETTPIINKTFGPAPLIPQEILIIIAPNKNKTIIKYFLIFLNIFFSSDFFKIIGLKKKIIPDKRKNQPKIAFSMHPPYFKALPQNFTHHANPTYIMTFLIL